MSALRVPARYAGPPGAANGGCLAGLVAERLDLDAARVRLLRPVPLETDLELLPQGAGRWRLGPAEAPCAWVEAAAPGLTPAPAPEPAETGRYAGFDTHPFPECFVCGPARGATAGLRLFAAPRRDGAGVAARWSVAEHWCGEDGRLPRFLLWALLDCPGAFAARAAGAAWPLLLGELCARVLRRPAAGERLVVEGRCLFSEGRKHRCVTAVFAAGEPLAWAEAWWIQPKGTDRDGGA